MLLIILYIIIIFLILGLILMSILFNIKGSALKHLSNENKILKIINKENFNN